MQSLIIPIPKCFISNQYIRKVCIHNYCTLYPFICDHCPNQECLTLHYHEKSKIKLWSELIMLINYNILCNNKGISQIIFNLKNKKYQSIFGKDISTIFKKQSESQSKYNHLQLFQNHSQNQIQQLQIIEEQTQTQSQQQQQQGSQESSNAISTQSTEAMNQLQYFDIVFHQFEILINADRNNQVAYNQLIATVRKLHMQETFLQYCKNKLQSDSMNIIIYYARGVFYFEQQKYLQALDDFIICNQIDNTYALAKSTLQKIQKLFDNQQFVLNEYNKILELNPEGCHYSLYIKRALLYYGKGEVQLALSDLNKAIILNNDVQILYMRARIHYERQQFQLLQHDCNEIIKLDSKDFKPYYMKSKIYFSRKQYQKALDECNTSIQLNPQSSITYNLRANIYQKLDHYYQSLGDYHKAIQLNPNDYIIHSNRALLYLNKNKLQQSLCDFNTAIQLNPKQQTIYRNRGIVYTQLKQTQKGLQDFNKAIQMNPKCIETYYNRALLYEQNKDFNLAQEDYNKIIELDPQCLQIYRKRALLLQKLNKFDEAKVDWKRLNSFYIDQKAHYKFGLLNFKLGNYILAQDDFNKSIEVENASRSYYYLGLIEIRKRNFKTAIKYIQIITQLDIDFDRQRYFYGNSILECLSQVNKVEEKGGPNYILFSMIKAYYQLNPSLTKLVQ